MHQTRQSQKVYTTAPERRNNSINVWHRNSRASYSNDSSQRWNAFNKCGTETPALLQHDSSRDGMIQ
ncbi:hypothetical protein RRG08_052665 [Elysia crispata]|uniref:Uncharacterized protein n=1 Tax=Elysia crispata TaxID=231223 RepID=A0AAE1D608_9GAST|nr:hypothetical protein RRG08_052665 [Elysia crispata]